VATAEAWRGAHPVQVPGTRLSGARRGMQHVTPQELAQHWPDVSFTPTEARVLVYLAARGGEPATEAQLLQDVWGYAPTARTRTVPTTIRRLRRKIETDPKRPRQLLFLRGQGYCLVPPDASPLTRAEVQRRLREWLGPDQEWVTLVAPAAGQRGYLPAPTAPMVGRTDALQALDERVRAGQRLITVHGAAGLGKTTLALALARSMREAFGGGAWFCPLEEARTVDDMLEAIARCIGITAAPGEGRSRQQQLVHALHHLGPVLLVLDNFEQLPGDASLVVARLLARAPDLQIVVTSRRVLGIAAEATHPLAPLSLHEGISLLERCLEQSGQPADEPELLPRIVELVEGVPLAIELAAARARLLPLSELVALLERDLGVLANPSGARPDRQKTLEEAIAWSWGLLDGVERETLAALGVFRGGFTVSAGLQVLDRVDGLDRLAALVDHAMLRRVAGGRLAVFESVRQFVARRAPVPTAVRARHAAWALAHAQHDAPGQGHVSHESLLVELDNLLAAHDFLLESADPRAIDLLDVLAPLFSARAVPRGLSERARRTRASVPCTPAQGATLNVILAGTLSAERSFSDARIEVERGLSRVQVGSRDHARLLNAASYLARQRGEHDAGLVHARAAEAIAQQLEALDLQCQSAMLTGASLLGAGDPAAAERAFSRAAERARRCGLRSQETQAQANRGSCLLSQGRTREALTLLEHARDLALDDDSLALVFSIHVSLAVAYLMSKRFYDADRLYADIIAEQPLHGAQTVTGVVHLNAGLTALHLDDPARAALLLAQARREFVEVGRTGSVLAMADAYRAVALAESGQGPAAQEIWHGLAPVEPDAAWPAAHGESALCRAHRHLLVWRRDRDPAALHAARQVLEEHGPDCADSAARVVLERALARCG